MKRIILGTVLLCLFLAACGKEDRVVTLTPATDLNPGEERPDPARIPQAPVNVAEEPVDCRIRVSNLTGKDIKELRLCFSEGSLGTVEILNGKTLYDGRRFSWEEDSLSVVQEKQGVRMSVSAVTSDGSALEFPEIALPDLSSTDLVLESDAEGERMYLR